MIVTWGYHLNQYGGFLGFYLKMMVRLLFVVMDMEVFFLLFFFYLKVMVYLSVVSVVTGV